MQGSLPPRPSPRSLVSRQGALGVAPERVTPTVCLCIGYQSSEKFTDGGFAETATGSSLQHGGLFYYYLSNEWNFHSYQGDPKNVCSSRLPSQ